jgi:hypothetical protein
MFARIHDLDSGLVKEFNIKIEFTCLSSDQQFTIPTSLPNTSIPHSRGRQPYSLIQYVRTVWCCIIAPCIVRMVSTCRQMAQLNELNSVTWPHIRAYPLERVQQFTSKIRNDATDARDACQAGRHKKNSLVCAYRKHITDIPHLSYPVPYVSRSNHFH